MSPPGVLGSLLNAHGCDSTQSLAAIGPSPGFLSGCQPEVCLSQPQEGPGILAMQPSHGPAHSMAADFTENLSHREFLSQRISLTSGKALGFLLKNLLN